jgi:hypothetical protein
MGFVNPYSEINQNRLGHSKAGDLKRKKSINIMINVFDIKDAIRMKFNINN